MTLLARLFNFAFFFVPGYRQRLLQRQNVSRQTYKNLLNENMFCKANMIRVCIKKTHFVSNCMYKVDTQSFDKNKFFLNTNSNL